MFENKPLGSLIKSKSKQKSEFLLKKHSTNAPRPAGLNLFLLAVVVLIGIYVVYVLSSSIYRKIANFSFLDFVWSLGSDLQVTDGRTNFLFMGKGGEGHDGPDLTDSMMLISLGHRDKDIAFLSLPRDLYVNIPRYGNGRINMAYYYGKQLYGDKEAYRLPVEVVEKVLNIKIHYYGLVDFKGFEKVVDEVGGVKVEVDNSFTDYQYPDGNHGWKTISFQKGWQEMDGKTALEFARSRHSQEMGEGNDFGRAKRQQKVITALKDKLFTKTIITDPNKIKMFYEILKSYFETNMQLREILSLGRFFKDFEQSNIRHFVITDGTYGLLYAPDEALRASNYQGAYVLEPKRGNFKDIQIFVDLIFNHGAIYNENAKLEVLNGTGRSGAGDSCQERLKSFGLNVINAADTDQNRVYRGTIIHDHTDNSYPNTASTLIDLLNAAPVVETFEEKPTQADITIILGQKDGCAVK